MKIKHGTFPCHLNKSVRELDSSHSCSDCGSSIFVNNSISLCGCCCSGTTCCMSASLESIGLADIRLLVKLMCLLAVGRVPESCLSVSLVPHAGPASMSVIPDLSFSMFVFYNKRYSDKGVGKMQTRYMPVCRRVT